MDRKPTVSFVVLGTVDSGKSTLIGHLMVKLGLVDTWALEKCAADSAMVSSLNATFKFQAVS